MFLAEAVSPQLSLSWEQASTTCAVLRLQGELEFGTAQLLKQESEQLCDRADRIVLDLSQVSFIDSAGMGALVTFYKRCAHDHELCLVVQTGMCRRLLDRVQLTRLLTTYGTLEEALTA